MMNRKKTVAVVMSLLLTANLYACGSNKVSRVTSAFDEKNYEEAIQLYNSDTWNEKDLEKIREQMTERMNSAVESYSGNTCTYEEVKELLSVISQMNIAGMTPDLSSAYATVEALYSSKEAYVDAMDSFNAEEYASAYRFFSNVIEMDAYYADAVAHMEQCVTKHCDAIREKVDGFVAKEDYNSALTYLGQESFSSFCDDIDTMINELTEDIQVKGILADAEDLVDAGDIAGALTCITESIESYKLKNTDELDKRYDSISADYVKMIMDKVNELSKNENYIAALNMLSNAQEVVDADEFKKAVEEIKAVKPTYLYDLKYSTSTRYETIDSGDPLMDTIGNTYEIGNLFEISSDGSSWSSEEGSVEYNLGYAYKTLSGVISVDDISDDATGVLKIEGDGATLFSLDLSRTMTPQRVSLDVSSVNWLKITITDPANGTIYAILSDFKFDTEKAATATTTPTEAASETAAETTAETAAATEA